MIFKFEFHSVEEAGEFTELVSDLEIALIARRYEHSAVSYEKIKEDLRWDGSCKGPKRHVPFTMDWTSTCSELITTRKRLARGELDMGTAHILADLFILSAVANEKVAWEFNQLERWYT